MAKENKGNVKITIEVEINDALMEMIKESMEKMPEMMPKFWGRGKKESE